MTLDFSEYSALAEIVLDELVEELGDEGPSHKDLLALGVSIAQGHERRQLSKPSNRPLNRELLTKFEASFLPLEEKSLGTDFSEAIGPLLTLESALSEGGPADSSADVQTVATRVYACRVPELPKSLECQCFAWTLGPSDSRMQPLTLRRFVRRLRFVIRQEAGISTNTLLDDATEVEDLDTILSGIAHMSRSEAAILWRFSTDEGTFREVASTGPVGSGYVLRFGGVKHGFAIQGIVSQVRPELACVAYEVGRSDLWVPAGIESWEPHDPGEFVRNNWHGCVAWPVLSNGAMLGAVSIYGRTIRELTYDPDIRGRASALVRDYLRQLEFEAQMESLEETYEEEIANTAPGALAIELLHDYKRALTRFSSFVDVAVPLVERRQDEGAKNVAKEAKESVELIRGITEGLRLAAKGQTQLGRCDPMQVLVEHSELIRRIAAEENKAASIVIPSRVTVVDPPLQDKAHLRMEIAMDESTWLRVVINLVRNAAYWTRGVHEPVIEISLELKSVGGRGRHQDTLIVLKVKDNGRGFLEEDRSRIFRRGFTRRHQDGGSGLGLHIVTRAVERADGTVQAWSRPSVSTVFRIALPNSKS